jgi:hypothetical protein
MLGRVSAGQKLGVVVEWAHAGGGPALVEEAEHGVLRFVHRQVLGLRLGVRAIAIDLANVRDGRSGDRCDGQRGSSPALPR